MKSELRMLALRAWRDFYWVSSPLPKISLAFRLFRSTVGSEVREATQISWFSRQVSPDKIQPSEVEMAIGSLLSPLIGEFLSTIYEYVEDPSKMSMRECPK